MVKIFSRHYLGVPVQFSILGYPEKNIITQINQNNYYASLILRHHRKTMNEILVPIPPGGTKIRKLLEEFMNCRE